MRSYALFLALAVLHAHAATIPAPETVKKLPIKNDALDDVSFDNTDSEQELLDSANNVKDVGNNLRNTIPENVPVKVIEEQPVIKTIALKENSNDYVPDNDDSANIKRVEIDLKNPGPPQRQEHDSQKPVTYLSDVEKEKAVVAIKKSIAESQSIFTRGIKDVTQKFEEYFANNEELTEVSKNIQNLRKNFDAEVLKLSNTINSYLKPASVEVEEGVEDENKPSGVKEVENRLKTLETSFNTGIGMLSEGVELLSILKEEDEQNIKISGKADNANVETGTSTGTAPSNPPASSGIPNPVTMLTDFAQNFSNVLLSGFNSLGTTIQNVINPNPTQNQNPSTNSTSQGGFNPANIFQGINLPNIFPQNQNPPQQQQGTAPVAAQSDDATATERPNFFQQIQNTLQNIVNPGQSNQQPTQQNPNPVSQFFTGVNQGISNFLQPWQGTQPAAQQTNTPAAQQTNTPAAQGTNSVPAMQPAQTQPAKETQPESVPVQDASAQAPAQSGPIQQMVQNNPIVKGISNAVQQIQGISNPTKPRNDEKDDSKGHGSGEANHGDPDSGLNVKSAPVKDQSEIIPEVQDVSQPAAELNKTE